MVKFGMNFLRFKGLAKTCLSSFSLLVCDRWLFRVSVNGALCIFS
jgi:hypothetical protein